MSILDELKKLREENKRVKEELQELNAKLKSQHVQIEVLEEILKYEWDLNERLDNIINEFEEELKWQRKVSLSSNEAFAISRIDILLNKLQELKGSDKQ